MTVRANNTHLIFNDATTQSTSGLLSASNVATTGASIIPVYSTGIPWQINTAIFISNANFGLVQDNVAAIFPKPDGTKFFTVGQGTDRVRELSLSTAWVMNTAAHDTNANVSVASQETNPGALFFNNDGNRMFVCGSVSDQVWQYELSTAWQVNTASHTTGANISISSQDINPQSISFNNTGSKMYMLGQTNKKVFEYNLSTAWQVNTATHTSTANLTIASMASIYSLRFSANGHKMYIACSNGDTAYIRQYNCSTAYRVNNATVDSTYEVVALYSNAAPLGLGTGFAGISFRTEGNTMYACAGNNIMEYDMDPQTLRIKSLLISNVNVSTNTTNIIIG